MQVPTIESFNLPAATLGNIEVCLILSIFVLTCVAVRELFPEWFA